MLNKIWPDLPADRKREIQTILEFGTVNTFLINSKPELMKIAEAIVKWILEHGIRSKNGDSISLAQERVQKNKKIVPNSKIFTQCLTHQTTPPFSEK